MSHSISRRLHRVVIAAVVGSALSVVGVAAAGPAGAATLTITGATKGNLSIRPGDTLRAGFDFSVPGGPAGDDVVSVTAGSVVVHGQCKDGTYAPLTIPLPAQTFTVPAHSTDWFPSDDPKSPVVYQGSIVVPASFCGGDAGHAPTAATFTADFAAGLSTPLNVRMVYADNTTGSWGATASVTPSPLPDQRTITLCEVTFNPALLGQVFTFTVGTSTVQVVAGAPTVGNCVSAGAFPAGSLVTITQQPLPGTKLNAITAPASAIVSSDFAAASVTITTDTANTVVTYTNG